MGKFNKLSGKKIAVIGGSSGIGFAVAEILIEAGAQVAIISSSENRVLNAVKQIKSPNVSGHVGDARDEEKITRILLSLAPLDHIVFSGVDKIIRGSIAEADLSEARHLFGVKFWGSIVTGKALAKHDIVKPGGSLTLTSGGAALRPGKGASIGGALNAGLLTFTKGLAGELTEKRIRVNTVIPGLVKTELWDKLGYSSDKQDEIFRDRSEKIPVGFVGQPEDVAEAYLYLIRADYANGSLVVIDGGDSI